LGRTIDEVVSHFTREALYRGWLTQEVERDRVPTPPAPPPRPSDRPRSEEALPQYPQRAEKRLVRLPEVCNRTGVSRSTLYKLIRLGIFPAPKHLGERAVAWLESEVNNTFRLQIFDSLPNSRLVEAHRYID